MDVISVIIPHQVLICPNLLQLAHLLEAIADEKFASPYTFDMQNHCTDKDHNPIEVNDYFDGYYASPIGHIALIWGEKCYFHGPEWQKLAEEFTFSIVDTSYQKLIRLWLYTRYWAELDNTPRGAAQRIWFMLTEGIPIEFEEWSVEANSPIPAEIVQSYQALERPADLYRQYGGDQDVELEYTWERELQHRRR